MRLAGRGRVTGTPLVLHDPGGASLIWRVGKAFRTGFVNIAVDVGAALRPGQEKRGGKSDNDYP